MALHGHGDGGTIAAVKIGPRELADPSWLHGPPYATNEEVFDEYDLEGCYPTAAERDEALDSNTGTPPTRVS